jgi:hypothetical protein
MKWGARHSPGGRVSRATRTRPAMRSKCLAVKHPRGESVLLGHGKSVLLRRRPVRVRRPARVWRRAKAPRGACPPRRRARKPRRPHGASGRRPPASTARLPPPRKGRRGTSRRCNLRACRPRVCSTASSSRARRRPNRRGLRPPPTRTPALPPEKLWRRPARSAFWVVGGASQSLFGAGRVAVREHAELYSSEEGRARLIPLECRRLAREARRGDDVIARDASPWGTSRP